METITLTTRFKNAWNSFMNRDPTSGTKFGVSYSSRPDRVRLTCGNERTILTSIYNRISLDVSSVDFRHCYLDADGRYEKDSDDELNSCLSLESNIDQTARAFIQDLVLSMIDEGCVAIVPVHTDKNIFTNEGFDIYTWRTGKILEWKPTEVYVDVYDDTSGTRRQVWYPKRSVGIIENPFYAVMNEPNSTMQRLKRKLALLDATDDKTASNKLDLIIQVPYSARSDIQKKRANDRRNDIETQLTGSKYGIAYIDGTEKVVQLNRSVENNLLKTIEFLTQQVFAQIGITQTILDGTADEATMLNYNSRVVDVYVTAICEEIKRKFLTKTARTQGQTIMAFRDPFRLVPINQIAEIADKFTRNEIMTSNEIRQAIHMKPSKDPKADQLVNSNISQPNEEEYEEGYDENYEYEE